MNQRTRKNNKRNSRNRKGTDFLDLAKAALISLAFGSLTAFGFIHLISGATESFDPAQLTPVEVVSVVGRPDSDDPTLRDELSLLKEERSKQGEESVTDSTLSHMGRSESDTSEEEQAPPAEESPEQEFPLYAVAHHFHAQMLEEPKKGAEVISYARRGATFRVSEKLSTAACRRGWHEVSPGGMFICNGNGVVVSAIPVRYDSAPPQPGRHRPMPYKYAYSARPDTLEYWKVPSEGELAEVHAVLARLQAREALEASTDTDSDSETDKTTDTAAPASAAPPATTVTAGTTNDTDPSGTQPTPAVPTPESAPATDTPSPAPAAAPVPAPVPANVPAAPVPVPGSAELPTAGDILPNPFAEDVVDTDTDTYDPYAFPPFVHLRMPVGYYVSVARPEVTELGVYQRTVRGRYILKKQLNPVEASTFEGMLVDSANPLPVVFVTRDGVNLLTQKKNGGAMQRDKKVRRYTRLPYLGTVKRGKRRYVQVGENLFLNRRVVTVIETVAPPTRLKPGEKWIDIDLSQQSLVAYEGETPVFATIVSTGRPEFATPEGSFRIYNKHVSITMDDTEAGAEAYSIEDVPWTQYFKDAYAIHAAFWHDRFGRVRSHGCINLSPADAHRVFSWTEPQVPEGIHGIAARTRRGGTRVFVHK